MMELQYMSMRSWQRKGGATCIGHQSMEAMELMTLALSHGNQQGEVTTTDAPTQKSRETDTDTAMDTDIAMDMDTDTDTDTDTVTDMDTGTGTGTGMTTGQTVTRAAGRGERYAAVPLAHALTHTMLASMAEGRRALATMEQQLSICPYFSDVTCACAF
jgi:predicted phosphoribosyltransferase